jgi:hypothetical protein
MSFPLVSSMRRLLPLTAIVLALAPGVASAKALCLHLAPSDLYFVFPSFSPKKGKSFPVGGYVTGLFTPTPQVFDTPLTGQAIATLDGQHLLINVTEMGGSFVHDGGSSSNLSTHLAAAEEMYSVQIDAKLPPAPGTTGTTLHFGVQPGGILSALTETVTVVDCTKIPPLLALP